MRRAKGAWERKMTEDVDETNLWRKLNAEGTRLKRRRDKAILPTGSDRRGNTQQ